MESEKPKLTAAEIARERRKQKLLRMEKKMDKPYEAPKPKQEAPQPPKQVDLPAQTDCCDSNEKQSQPSFQEQVPNEQPKIVVQEKKENKKEDELDEKFLIEQVQKRKQKEAKDKELREVSSQIVQQQKDRELSAFHMVILRTLIPLIFGVWCHVVHATSIRTNKYAGMLQLIFCLPTFILIDLLLIWASKKDEQNRTKEINRLMSIQSGESVDGGEGFEKALGQVGQMMNMVENLTNSKWIGRAKQALLVFTNIKEFSMDMSLYLFGMFLADSIFMMVASYMSNTRDIDMNSTIQFKSLGINWNF